MNESIVSAMVANPYVFFLKFVVEALPAAAFAYSLVWLVMRPKNGRHIPSPFLWHFYGVVAAVGGGAAFRIIALVTFAGRAAYEPESAAAGFYLMIVPAAVAVAYVAVRLRALVGETTPAFKFPSWVIPVIGGVFVAGIVLAVALPALQDRAKGQVASKPLNGKTQAVMFDDLMSAPTTLKPFYGKTDEEIAQANAKKPTTDWSQFTPVGPDPDNTLPIKDQFGGTLVDSAKGKPFTYEEATAPQGKGQPAEYQEHYRQIYAAHPDADALVESASFKAWVAKYPTYQRFVDKGTAQEIIGMFTAYKNQR